MSLVSESLESGIQWREDTGKTGACEVSTGWGLTGSPRASQGALSYRSPIILQGRAEAAWQQEARGSPDLGLPCCCVPDRDRMVGGVILPEAPSSFWRACFSPSTHLFPDVGTDDLPIEQ